MRSQKTISNSSLLVTALIAIGRRNLNAFTTFSTTKVISKCSLVTHPLHFAGHQHLSRASPNLRLATSSDNFSSSSLPTTPKHDQTTKELHAVSPTSNPTPFFAVIEPVLAFISKYHTFLIASLILLLSLMLSPLSLLAVKSGGRFGAGIFPTAYPSGATGISPYARLPEPSSSIIVNPSPIISSPSPWFYNPFYTSPFYYLRPSFGNSIVFSSLSALDAFLFSGIFLAALTAIFVSTSTNERITKTSSRGVGLRLRDYDNYPHQTGSTKPRDGISIVKISVALDVPKRDDPYSILSVLERLANTSTTDTRVGVQTLTNQIAMELLRRFHSIIASSTSSKQYKDVNMAQREFNAITVNERGKFERETVSKFGGVDYISDTRPTQMSPLSVRNTTTVSATVAVVTMILAINGETTVLPSIHSKKDIENALRRIAVGAKVDDCLRVEILWTPTDRNEVLSKKEIIADYPDLTFIR